MEIFENKLIVSFLDDIDNRELFESYQKKNSDAIKSLLDERFRSFYQKYRLVSYLIKVLHFESKHFDRKIRQHNNRYQLAKTDTGEADLIFEQDVSENRVNNFDFPLNFQDHLTNEELFNSFSKLTEKQKNVLTLAYQYQMTDTEIAKSLGVTQQSIYKTRKSAITKLRDGVKSVCWKESLLCN